MIEQKHESRPPFGAKAPARLAELRRLVAEAEQRRASARPFHPGPYALGGLVAGAARFAAGTWAASRHFP